MFKTPHLLVIVLYFAIIYAPVVIHIYCTHKVEILSNNVPMNLFPNLVLSTTWLIVWPWWEHLHDRNEQKIHEFDLIWFIVLSEASRAGRQNLVHWYFGTTCKLRRGFLFLKDCKLWQRPDVAAKPKIFIFWPLQEKFDISGLGGIKIRSVSLELRSVSWL